MGGSSGGSGPTKQQEQLQTAQALTTANLNLAENAQRKTILSGMQGTRVFRGSALSRALAGNTPGSAAAPAAGPSPSQNLPLFAPGTVSLLDKASQRGAGSGSTSSGGTGTSGGGGTVTGGRTGGSGGGGRSGLLP